MERNRVLRYSTDMGQRNMLHTSQMHDQSGQDHIHYASRAVRGHNSQFPHHDSSARNHYFHRLPDHHLSHLSYRARYSGQDHLHYAPHAISSDNFQFPHHDISARNQNFHHFPDHCYNPISYRTHSSGLQNHQPMSDVDFVGAATASSNFYNRHLIPSSNSISYPNPLNYRLSIAMPDHNHLVQHTYIDPSFQPPTLNSVELHTEISSGEGNLTLKHTTTISYSHGSNDNGSSLDIRSMGGPQYPGIESHGILASNSNSSDMNHYWLHQHQPPPPMQAMRGNNFNLQPEVPSSSYRHPMNNPLQHNTTNHYLDIGNRNFGPSTEIPSILLGGMIILPEDGVAMLGLPNLNVRPDTLMDDVEMSYEELLSLEEQMGNTNIGLSKETIVRHLKTRTHVLSANHLNLNEHPSMDQEPEICVICQGEYKTYETIGTLQCGHDYHADCVKKWLLEKNVCPICKATALNIES